MITLSKSKHVRLVPVDSMSEACITYGMGQPRHRRISLAKSVSLQKRAVPNADTLVRSGLLRAV